MPSEQCKARALVDEGGRECSACGIYKPRSDYSTSVLGKFGMASMCKACSSAKGKAKRAAAAALKPKRRADADGKECSKCGVYKPQSEYGKDKHNRDGLTSACRECRNEQFEKWASVNQEKLKASQARWNKKNIDYVRTRARNYAAERRGQIGKTEYAHRMRVYRENNIERWGAYNKRFYAKNRDRLRETQKLDRKTRPEAHAAYDAAKRSKRKKGHCAWANLDAIKQMYRTAQLLSKYSGEKFHVDHIVPLTSDIVQGLHVECNLRIILASDNLNKSNKFDPDNFDPREIPSLHYEDILKDSGSELLLFGEMIKRSMLVQQTKRFRQLPADAEHIQGDTEEGCN